MGFMQLQVVAKLQWLKSKSSSFFIIKAFRCCPESKRLVRVKRADCVSRLRVT